MRRIKAFCKIMLRGDGGKMDILGKVARMRRFGYCEERIIWELLKTMRNLYADPLDRAWAEVLYSRYLRGDEDD